MTENEAIKEIETSLELAEMCKPNREREKEIKAYKMAIQALEKVQQFESIGTVEEFKALKEKAEPKKQGNINDYGSHLKLTEAGFLCCSTTNKAIRYPLISLRDLEYCPCCGQKLDWE